MIRNIVFDIGNVLADFCWREHIQGMGFQGETAKRLGKAMMQSPVWNELDAFLSQTFTTADGRRLKIICACVDYGGHFTTNVYRFCKERTARRVFAIKGKGGAEVPYFGRPSTSNIVKAPLFTVGVDTGKALLYQRLAVKKWGPNFCHFPAEEGRG